MNTLNYKQRMLYEFKELTLRIEDLFRFLNKIDNKEIEPPKDFGTLKEQYETMLKYASCLEERLLIALED